MNVGLSVTEGKRLTATSLIASCVVLCGCTTALWDGETFAHHFRPAVPSNLKLFYSSERRDVLVHYDERKDTDENVRPRCYWLDVNLQRVNEGRRAQFVSVAATNGLVSIPVFESTNSTPTEANVLYAVQSREMDAFYLYGGQQMLACCTLPVYKGGSQRVYQVMLTPLAVAGDAAATGAVGVLQSPDAWLSLNSLSK